MSYDTEDRLSAALSGIVGDRPYAPDLDQIRSRGRELRRRRLAWRVTGAGSFAVAAVAAVAVATSGAGTQAPAPNLAAPKPATAGTANGDPLVQLVGYLSTAKAPTGDATLMLRDQVFKTGPKIDVWDLNADNGDYYFGRTRGALQARVKHKHPEPSDAGRKKSIAAAEYAAKGDLNEARRRMAYADDPSKVKPPLEAPGVTPPVTAEMITMMKKKGMNPKDYHPINQTDNQVWNNSVAALTDSSGSPAVRAGVLRLLGQMPEVKVSKGTLHGHSVLTLAAGAPATNFVNGTETLTVDAGNGLLVRSTSNGLIINYTTTRVTLADVAIGKF